MPPDTKARFAALAARHHLNEASLLAKMVNEVLGANSLVAQELNQQRSVCPSIANAAGDRITLRLRPGDRTLAAKRARARGMKAGSYLAMLIHNHVRDSAVLPPNELDQIRATCSRLAALGRQLGRVGMPNTLAESWASELSDAISLVRQEVETAREATAAVVRRNLASWETRAEVGDV
ncbi:hypothetical protein D3C71_1606500 [compost metagenome]